MASAFVDVYGNTYVLESNSVMMTEHQDETTAYQGTLFDRYCWIQLFLEDGLFILVGGEVDFISKGVYSRCIASADAMFMTVICMICTLVFPITIRIRHPFSFIQWPLHASWSDLMVYHGRSWRCRCCACYLCLIDIRRTHMRCDVVVDSIVI